MRWIVVIVMLVAVLSGKIYAQTETPLPTATATPTNTPTPEPYVYATVIPAASAEFGQMTRFDYTATAGDVQIATLLLIQLISLWAMFLFEVLVLSARRKK